MDRVLIGILLAGAVAEGAKAEDKAIKAAFVEQLAKAASNALFRDHAQPIRLRAKFTFSEPGQNARSGSTLLVRFSDTLWRQQIAYPGFEEARTAMQDKLWIRRNVGLEPAEVSQLHEVLNFASYLKIGGMQKIHKVRALTGKTCAEIGPGKPYNREVCLDTEGHVVSIRWMAASSKAEDVLEISSYVKVGAKEYPTSFHLLDMGRRTMDVEVEEVGPPLPSDAKEMLPPPAAEQQDWCPNPEGGMSYKFPDLGSAFAPFSPSSTDSWRIRIYAILDVDGRLKNVTLTEAPQGLVNVNRLNKIMADAKLPPATCAGKPIKKEWRFYLNFNRAR